MGKGVHLRTATPADWPAIERSFGHCTLEHRAPAVWRWRYACDGDGQGPWRASVAVADDGEVAGFVGGLARRVQVGGMAWPVLCVRDAFMHPNAEATEAAGDDVVAQMARQFDQLCAADFAATAFFGSAGGLAQVWCTQGPVVAVPMQDLILRVDPAAAALGVACILVPTRFDEADWDTLAAARTPHRAAGLVADRSYLAWRIDPRQGRPVEAFAMRSIVAEAPLGYVVLHALSDTDLRIVELVLPRDAVSAVHALAQLTAWAAQRGVRTLSCRVALGAPEHSLLRAQAWEPEAEPQQRIGAWRVHPGAALHPAATASLAQLALDSDLS